MTPVFEWERRKALTRVNAAKERPLAENGRDAGHARFPANETNFIVVHLLRSRRKLVDGQAVGIALHKEQRSVSG